MVAQALEERGVTSLGARVIRTHAEKLHDHQRKELERVFGGKVFEHYGSREISEYGVECAEHKGIHLFSNLRLFELDAVAETADHRGEVLVTDFANYAMPFLRYRNGDVITIERGKCACGRSLPRATVDGRSFDMVRLRDGSIISVRFFNQLMDPMLVERFLVHQRTYDRLDVHIVPTAAFTDEYRDCLIREIRDKTKAKDTRVILKKEIDVTVAGKYRLVRSDISSCGTWPLDSGGAP
jgi:phenylacetate-CoA ligase